MCKVSAFSSCQEQSVLSVAICAKRHIADSFWTLFPCAENCEKTDQDTMTLRYPDPDWTHRWEIHSYYESRNALKQEKWTGRNWLCIQWNCVTGLFWSVWGYAILSCN